jgi:hypothetical protein
MHKLCRLLFDATKGLGGLGRPELKLDPRIPSLLLKTKMSADVMCGHHAEGVVCQRISSNQFYPGLSRLLSKQGGVHPR